MAEEITNSNTRFKLEEASYFFEQMNKNLDNLKYFIFNLIAFVSAGQSVTYVMQCQYKKGEDDAFWKWYVPNVQEALKNDEDALFFHKLRVKVLKQQGNPKQDILTTVSSIVTARYNIIGSAPENEEKLIELDSERESQVPTVTDNPEAQVPIKKYVWYIGGIEDKTKKSRKYVIPTCGQYLNRLSGLVNECERQFG